MEEAPLRPPPPRVLRIALLVGVLTVAGLGAFLFSRLGEELGEQDAIEAERAAAAEAAGQAAEVRVVRPTAAEAAPVIVLTGNLEPAQSADLAFEVPGRVARVDVALGQLVEEGDVLVALDRSSVGAQSAQSAAAIRVAEASAEMARDRVQMLEPLVSRGTMPERELTTARQQLAIAEAQLSQARAGRRQVAASSADHVLRAPFDGVVTQVPSGVGVAANPGVSLVRIEDLTSLRLRTTVNRRELEALRVGVPVAIEGTDVQGTVATVVRSLDAATRRAPVEVSVPNEGEQLVANAFVRGRVTLGAPRPVLRLPSSCVRPDGTVLLVGEGSRVVVREVSAEIASGGGWDVYDGLSAEDQVVLRPAEVTPGVVIRPELPPPAQANAEPLP